MTADLSKPWHHVVDVGIDPELMDHNVDCDLSNYTYPCRSCGEETPVEDPFEFDITFHYCGRSMRCIP